MESAIEVKQLKKKIDDFQLGPIDISFKRGTVTALAGKNSAGKTTFLKLLLKLAKADAGEINIFSGEDINNNDNWKKIVSYQPQTIIGVDSFTGKDLKELFSRWYPSWKNDLFNRLIGKFEVPLHRRYGKLSPGAQKKLRLALTIACNTEIVVLDEPTAHIDIPAKNILIDTVIELLENEEKTVIIATHQVEEIKKLSDYIAIFKDGNIMTKFELTGQYYQIKTVEEVDKLSIPGEITRLDNNTFITNNATHLENYLEKKNIKISEVVQLQLEQLISLIS